MQNALSWRQKACNFVNLIKIQVKIIWSVHQCGIKEVWFSVKAQCNVIIHVSKENILWNRCMNNCCDFTNLWYIPLEKDTNHSVEISWIFYHSDFTWNLFWGFAILTHLEVLNFDFLNFSTFKNAVIKQANKNESSKNCKNDSFINFLIVPIAMVFGITYQIH